VDSANHYDTDSDTDSDPDLNFKCGYPGENMAKP